MTKQTPAALERSRQLAGAPPTALDLWRDARTEQFRRAVIRLREMSIEIDELALILDDSGGACTCCDAVTYRHWEQRQLRARVKGAADRMREIAGTLDDKARNPDFIGEPMPDVLDALGKEVALGWGGARPPIKGGEQ